MRNIVKAFLVLTLLIGGLALSACRSSEEAGMLYGRYLEADITPPIDGTFINLLAPDGTLAAFDSGLLNRYNSADGGETWTSVPGPGRGASPGRYEEVDIAAFLPDGRLIVFIPDEGLVTISPDGTTAPFPVDVIDTAIADEDIVVMLKVQPIDNDRLLLNYSIISTGGGQGFFTTIDDEDEDDEFIEDIEAVGDDVDFSRASVRSRVTSFIFGGAMGGGTITVHDISTGALVEELPVIEFGATLLSQRADGGQYLLRDANIILNTEKEFDIVLEGLAFAFGAPNNTVVSKTALADGDIIVQVLVRAEHRLFRYTWDEDAPINPDRSITIWALEDNNTVRAAITEVMRRFPDAYINFEVATGGSAAISTEDAIRNLNTRLLSGQAPDILILDGTPLDSYVRRGILKDLSLIDTSDMHGNMLASLAENGKYVIPTQFMVPVMMGDAENIAGIETLEALVDTIVNGNPAASMVGRGMMGGLPEEERPAFQFSDLEEVYNMLWLTGSSAFIENGRLNTGALTRFLAAIDAIDKKYELSAPDDMMGGVIGMSIMMVGVGSGGGRPSVMTGSTVNYMMHMAHLAALTLDNLMPFQMVTVRGGDIAPFPGLAQRTWVPSTMAAVTADSAVPEFAKIFVETMLAPDIQRINHGHGLPITRSGVTAQIDAINESLAENNPDAQPFDVDINALAQSLTTPALTETVLRETIWNSVQRLTAGTLTLEGAVREIEANLSIYLAERS